MRKIIVLKVLTLLRVTDQRKVRPIIVLKVLTLLRVTDLGRGGRGR